nr:Imm42 family immunity protein [Luteibacter rhizovicinus]
MIIGEKTSFAIEFDLDKDFGGAWIFGRFCYWVGGSMLGDYDLGTSLRDVLFLMTQVVGDSGNRFSSMCDMDAGEVFHALNETLYGTAEIVDLAGRFDVSIPVDVFDDVKIFLLDCQGGTSKLLYSTGGVRVEEMSLAFGEFDRVLKACYDELGQIYGTVGVLQDLYSRSQ